MHRILSILLGLLAVYIGLTMTLFALSRRFPRLAFYARLLASYLALIVCAAFGVVASICLRLVGHGRVSQWATARSFKWVMRCATGVTVEIDGGEHLKTRPAVFIGNHQSELDVLILGATFPPYCSVTAKKSLKRVPFLGWFMALSGTVFIDRGNRENAMVAFAGAASEMRDQKQSVFIFPEGTRSYYVQPDLLPFKKGAFHLAIQAKVPIVPIVVANYSDVLHVPSRIFHSGLLHVKVLPPIPTSHLAAKDVDDFTKNTRDLMLHELVQLTRRSRPESSVPVDDGVAKSTSVEYNRQHVGGKVLSAL